ncbi:MAG: peptide chain release factor N(5)-glutamine methyltransferase [Thermodesulfovibrionales bacterium]|jgi:release factor glutamine methyltransferase|nr:peptide chain release factor N(5)-glutamine methyltransferase [Thermodesulfovibrionales bacterium]
MTAIDKLKEVSAFLESKGIEDAAKEAEILITEALHIDKSELYSGSLEVSDETSRHIDSLALRRAEGEPIQYIIGHVDFYGMKINVGRGVLIPRPETELLVEETIKILHSCIMHYASRITILDLCTGSGCIAIALAKHLPDADVYGIDKSDTAIHYATRNATENDVRNVHFIKGDLFEPVGKMAFDCIVSNPPYIKTADIQGLQREIKDYEPVDALNGGEDGLDFYRRIFENAHKFLKENGIIILEIGHDQADDVEKIAMNAGFKNVTFIKDYAGIKRIFIGRKNEAN